MEISKRTFLKTCSLGVAAAICGRLPATGGDGKTTRVYAAGFAGWAEALAMARGRLKSCLCVGGSELLPGWRDSDKIQIMQTGHAENGKWRLETRGLCMEFMLRMEIMGPIASTPHPRPGQPWMPVLQVEAARRLMNRMLTESHVDMEFNVKDAEPFSRDGFQVDARDIISGQKTGIERAMAAGLGMARESLNPQMLRLRIERELSLPG